MLTIPAIVSPAATSATSTPVDEIATCFASVLAKTKLLQRVASSPSTSVCCCAHWIDLPLAMSLRERVALFDMVCDVSASLMQVLDIPVDQHDVLILDTDPHDTLESMIECMEARDLTYHDLHSYLEFLKTHVGRRCVVTIIPCPARITENMFELLRLGHHIIHGFSTRRGIAHRI